jgi:hypothetical protein
VVRAPAFGANSCLALLSETYKFSFYLALEFDSVASAVGQNGSDDIRAPIAVQSWDAGAEFPHRMQMEVLKLC